VITITFHRKSVCMGDDAGNGEYTIQLPETASLGDLMHVILRGGNGNDWPIPYTGANSLWVIKSNVGNLAEIFTDQEGEWHTAYPSFTENTPLQSLGIMWIFGDRADKEPVYNNYKKTCMTGKEIKECLTGAYGKVRPYHGPFTGPRINILSLNKLQDDTQYSVSYNDSFFKITDAETGSGLYWITYTKENPKRTI